MGKGFTITRKVVTWKKNKLDVSKTPEIIGGDTSALLTEFGKVIKHLSVWVGTGDVHNPFDDYLNAVRFLWCKYEQGYYLKCKVRADLGPINFVQYTDMRALRLLHMMREMKLCLHGAPYASGTPLDEIISDAGYPLIKYTSTTNSRIGAINVSFNEYNHTIVELVLDGPSTSSGGVTAKFKQSVGVEFPSFFHKMGHYFCERTLVRNKSVILKEADRFRLTLNDLLDNRLGKMFTMPADERNKLEIFRRRLTADSVANNHAEHDEDD